KGAAIGLGLLTLLDVISWMELLPIDYGQVLNSSFTEILFPPIDNIVAIKGSTDSDPGLDVGSIVALSGQSSGVGAPSLSDSWTAVIGDQAAAWRVGNVAAIQRA